MRMWKFPGLFVVRASAGWVGGLRRRWGSPRRRGAIDVVLFGFVLAASLGCFAQDAHPAASTSAEAASSTESAAKSQQLQKIDDDETARRKQISEESARLLEMALALKAEVDKTNKDTLSLKVIRKADEIERLAKTVKEKLKQGSRN